MLNDLLVIERRLSAQGVPLVGKHPDVKDMAKGAALRVRLSEDGAIADVQIIEQAGQGAVWTLRDGQHNGFPGLKTATGLLELDERARKEHDDTWAADKSPGGRRSELRRLLSTFPLNISQTSTWPNAGHRKRITARLAALRVLADDPLTAAVPATFERFLRSLEATPSLLEALTSALAEYVENGGEEWLDFARSAFVGPVALVIDVNTDDFQRDACDPRQVDAVSAALSSSGETGGCLEEADVCALTGITGGLHAGNFPQPNLPGLGQTYLFSRNKDIPSLTRYGRTADASFAIGAGLVRQLSGAIEKLTQAAAKGKTWRLIPAETGDKPDLMVVSYSDPSLALADAVVGDDDEDVETEDRLLQLASNIIEQSKGTYQQDHAEDLMTVLILRTVDPANRKTVYHRSASPQAFARAAKEWHAATSNTPDWLGFRIPVKNEPRLVFRRPPHVGPLSITPLSRTLFANGGRRRVDVIGVPASLAFALFLRDGDVSKRAHDVLRLLLSRHTALLLGLVRARAKGIEQLKAFDPRIDLRRDALRSIGWLGVLLDRLGRTREDYMSDAAFKLGQLLNAADLVHVGYCADLRGGDVPPNLLGNSVFAIAGGNPARAISILQRRWKPYEAWGRQVARISGKIQKLMEGKDEPLAWDMRRGLSHARRIGPIAAELAAQFQAGGALSTKPDDQFRAELLLGYLAGLPPLAKRLEASTDDDLEGGQSE